MQSGRPDVFDEYDNNITSDVYVDLFEGNYVLRQVIDDNHTLIKGRRGTGKSTIFVKAEDYIRKNKPNALPIYINLQTCYEDIKTSCAESEYNELTQLRTYKNFLNEILAKIKEKICDAITDSTEFNKLFEAIDKGEYMDIDFKTKYEVEENLGATSKKGAEVNLAITSIALKAGIGKDDNNDIKIKKSLNEIRIYSIHAILKRIKEILISYGIIKIYLFLDDFSELNKDKQKVIVDSLIAPIIASYNDYFKIKIAAYPGRIYIGTSDATKIVPASLDFYDAYERSTKNYAGIEKASINYIRRTLEKRLEVYTSNQISIDELFAITEKFTLDHYLKRLFECTAAIPRSLGFILNYCYLSSINEGNPITMDNIDSSAIKYFEDNIYADFINDSRFKQSFYDDKNLLDQVAQKNLMDQIIKYLYEIKRNIIKVYQEGKLENVLFRETLENNKISTNYWFPTSYFYIGKEYENLLKTLELSYIVNKVNEGSTRGAGEIVSYYSLNYGLCLSKKIDFGRPEGRRKNDYWRQDEFDLTQFIPKALSNIEVIQCSNCEKIYSELEYTIYSENKFCFKCTKYNSVSKKNKFQSKLETKMEEWKQKSLPDTHICILRALFNNRDKKLSATEIGKIIDKHNLTVTNAAKTLTSKEYIKYESHKKRYYYITEKSIADFFSDSIDNIY
jgi:hypothetical protein